MDGSMYVKERHRASAEQELQYVMLLAPRTIHQQFCHIFHLPFDDQTVKLLDKLRAGEINCGRSTTAADANQSYHGHYCLLCHTTEC